MRGAATARACIRRPAAASGRTARVAKGGGAERSRPAALKVQARVEAKGMRCKGSPQQQGLQCECEDQQQLQRSEVEAKPAPHPGEVDTRVSFVSQLRK